MAAVTSTSAPTSGQARIETERLDMHFFNPDSEQDCANLIKIYNHPDRVALCGNPNVNNRDDLVGRGARAALPAKYCKSAPPNYPWCLCHLKDTGEFLGHASVHVDPTDPDWGAQVGYSFSPEVLGRGYATEAFKALLKFYHDSLGLEHVFAVASINNYASCRVAEKAGGRLSDKKKAGGLERKDSEGRVTFEWKLLAAQ